MRIIRYLFAVTLLVLTASIQFANAQSLETQMQNFFRYNNNRAYKVLSRFAHPTNTFSSGYCELYGNYLYITIHSTSYTTRIKLHKNGSVFDSLEVLDDTDYYPAFKASNNIKDFFVEFLRDYSPQTISKIERIFGSLYDLNSKQMCLAALSMLLWSYPSSSSSSSYSSGSQTSRTEYLTMSGYIDGKYAIKMSVTIKGKYVSGSYYYTKKGSNNKLKLEGLYEDGLMYLREYDEYGSQTGNFLGSYSNGLFQGQFTTRGKQLPFKLYK